MTTLETARPIAAALNNRNAESRLTFLDWTRGLAVTIMLQGHVFHSFARADVRGDGPYVLSQFFGGLGPAVFLVLTGITLAFLMDRRERQGLAPAARWRAALRRAGYLFLLAFLFRIQVWVFGFPQSPAAGLLKVDILNCMGFAIALLSAAAFFTTAERVRLCAGVGVAIAAASPLISALDWRWLPHPLSDYFVPSYDYFAFFPWAAFIAFGMSIGSMLRLAAPDQMNRIMQWGALAGFGLVLGGQYFSNLPYSVYPKSEFWLDSPGLIAIKLGVVLLVMCFAFVWTGPGAANAFSSSFSRSSFSGSSFSGSSFSWMRQFGTASLVVYWAHIELVYGRWFGFWKGHLNNWECAAFAAALIPGMLLLAVAKTRWTGLRLPALFAPYRHLSPRRASGD